MKKSFVLHIDSLNVLTNLSTQQAGELFLAIYNYHLSGVTPEEFWLKIALSSFINQWERDSEKWDRVAEIRKENGRKGGLMKAQNKDIQHINENLANASNTKQTLANDSKPSVNVSVSGSVSVNGSGSVKEKKSLKKDFTPPTLAEVTQWFTEQGSTAEAGAKAWQYYTDGNWHDAKGSPVKSWRQKMRGGRWLETTATNPTAQRGDYENLNTQNTYSKLNELNNTLATE
jgi:hypothetical protein